MYKDKHFECTRGMQFRRTAYRKSISPTALHRAHSLMLPVVRSFVHTLFFNHPSTLLISRQYTRPPHPALSRLVDLAAAPEF
jgi:hypothetical protein